VRKGRLTENRRGERRVRWLRRDGVTLFHEIASGVAPPVLLIHGWCCDHTYFAPQFEHFANRGQCVVAVDLRGHGQSDKPRQDYTMQVFSDDLAWLFVTLGLDKPVVIGHSMGGIIAFDLACRYPEAIRAVVMLDAAVVLPVGAKAAIPQMIEELRDPNYREAQRRYVAGALFLPTDDQARKEHILDKMSCAPQHVMVSAMEGLHRYDPTAVAPHLKAPALYIAADEPQPRADMTRFHEICPNLMFGQTVGSGHFCQLEVPEQINPMIERFLTVVL
jgi:pimeloyl-ACP methyl ester carboxylesterase